MRVRPVRPLPQLAAALLLGVGAALLVACGGSTKGGIPAASAGELKSQIEDVQQAVEGGRCKELDGQLRQVDEGIEALPATVDQRLRQSLADAGDRLRRTAIDECGEATTTETETTEPVETTTQPPETTTAPAETTETEPEETETVPPPQPPPPPVTTTPAPPPPVQPPPVQPAPAPAPVPPATPGGGATPGNGTGPP